MPVKSNCMLGFFGLNWNCQRCWVSKWAEGRSYQILIIIEKTHCVKLSKSIISMCLAYSADMIEIVLQTQNFKINANPIARGDTRPRCVSPHWLQHWLQSRSAQNGYFPFSMKCWRASFMEALSGVSHFSVGLPVA